jgi:pimeloyl-ACP methyl ester carboxylesterase
MTQGRRGWPRLPFPMLGGIALALAGAALANHLIARRSERRHPPLGRFIAVEGLRLHVLDLGDPKGSPVVLLHGNGASVEDFTSSGLPEALAAAGHRVLVFDRPGFGHSERPGQGCGARAQSRLIRQALRQLGLPRPVLVGHSWGCLVALAMALDQPEETGALVLLAGYFRPSLRLDVPLVALAALPLLGGLLRHTIAQPLGWLLGRWLVRQSFAPQPVSAEFEKRFPLALAMRPSQFGASAADTATMMPDALGLLRRAGTLDLPVQIVAGAADQVLDTRYHSGTLHRRVAGSRLWIVPGAGHMIHHVAPQEVLDAIRDAAAAAQAARPEVSSR